MVNLLFVIDLNKIDLTKINIYSKRLISGYMSMEARERLRKQRGIPVYVYKADDFTLLYVFDSKQQMYDSIRIHPSIASFSKVKAIFILIQI